MGSTRFPGKMLESLGDLTVLEWVLYRCLKSQKADQVVMATSIQPQDDILEKLANKYDVACYRGSESDVLSRFVKAARLFHADIVIRVCADNPFIAPEEIDRLVDYFSKNSCDYACNHQDRMGSNYADGFGAEILDIKTLERIFLKSDESKYREHVTLFIWDNPDLFSIKSVPAPHGLNKPELRFDVDTEDDFLYLQRLVSAGVTKDSTAIDIVKNSHSISNQRV